MLFVIRGGQRHDQQVKWRRDGANEGVQEQLAAERGGGPANDSLGLSERLRGAIKQSLAA